MNRLVGIETEYGITRLDLDAVDVVAESIELVAALPMPAACLCWDYNLEDPHRDLRGFRAGALEQDRDEIAYDAVDGARGLSHRQIKADRVLTNGARFYNDHAHPEYSTPECRSLADLVAHDRAGLAILERCRQARNRALGGDRLRLYRNNTDFAGHSYGCHENYLVPRALPFDRLAAALLAWLPVRQLVAGAGKAAAEQAYPGGAGFQLSQRADFVEIAASIDTMTRRPIVNTRDEPHADPARWRRLHVIIGDANMCEWATALKVGTTALVLDLVEAGRFPPDLALADPVGSVRRVAAGVWAQPALARARGRPMTAVDMHRRILDAVGAWSDPPEWALPAERAWVLAQWARFLDAFAARDRDWMLGRVDWATKEWLLELHAAAGSGGEVAPGGADAARALDLAYHDVDPETGLYFGLEREAAVWRLVTPAAIEAAVTEPPADTRALLRGRCVQRWPGALRRVQWERIELELAGERVQVELGDLIEPDAVARRAAEFGLSG